jgi:hypothetical protein
VVAQVPADTGVVVEQAAWLLSVRVHYHSGDIMPTADAECRKVQLTGLMVKVQHQLVSFTALRLILLQATVADVVVPITVTAKGIRAVLEVVQVI